MNQRGGGISKSCKKEAIIINVRFSAKHLPGQLLIEQNDITSEQFFPQRPIKTPSYITESPLYGWISCPGLKEPIWLKFVVSEPKFALS